MPTTGASLAFNSFIITARVDVDGPGPIMESSRPFQFWNKFANRCHHIYALGPVRRWLSAVQSPAV